MRSTFTERGSDSSQLPNASSVSSLGSMMVRCPIRVTVSMVSGVSDDAAQTRTYQVRRRKADGVAFAKLLAGKYGLTREQMKRRILG